MESEISLIDSLALPFNHRLSTRTKVIAAYEAAKRRLRPTAHPPPNMPKAQEKINSSAPRPVSIFRVQLYVKNWAWNVKFHLVERDNTPHHHSSMTSVDREQNAPSDAELLEDLQGEVFMNFHHTVRDVWSLV